MFEQIDNDVTFFAQFLLAGAKGTGLTITCTVYKGSTGAALVTDQAATEVGSSGVYKYLLTANYVDAEDEYVAVFSEAAATADQTDVAAMWAVGRAGIENLTQLGSGDVTVVAPVSADGETLNLVRGDDYTLAENRSIEFTSAAWPDLTGATEVFLTLRRRAEGFTSGGTSDPILISRDDVPGSRIVGGGSQTVVFELDNDTPGDGESGDTGALLVGTAAGKFDVQATLASGDIVTLVLGVVNVTEDQTRA